MAREGARPDPEETYENIEQEKKVVVLTSSSSEFFS